MFRNVSRKFLTVSKVAREQGISGVADFMRRRAELQRKLHAARSIVSVDLDGCTFDLHGVPDTPMKLALIEGKYEDFERQAVLRYLNPQLPVIELGACIGVVSCIANRRLRDPRQHIVVEANPFAIPLLEHHRSANQCEFDIVNAAVAYGQDFVEFSPEKDLWGNSLRRRESDTAVKVRSVSLREIVTQRDFDRFTLICDIEGHEFELIQAEADIFTRMDTLILETHPTFIGVDRTNELLERLRSFGLAEITRNSTVVVMKRAYSDLNTISRTKGGNYPPQSAEGVF